MLPDKPSELLKLAIASGRHCLGNPEVYIFDERFFVWNTVDVEDPDEYFRMSEEQLDIVADGGSLVAVGLAGAVMTQFFGHTTNTHREMIWPWGYDDQRKLRALGDLHYGEVPLFLRKLRVPAEKIDEELSERWDMCADDPDNFLSAVWMLQCSLEERGL